MEGERGKPRGPSPAGVWARRGLTLLMIGWAFALGIMVGQGYLVSPDQVAWLKEHTGLDRVMAPPPPPVPETRAPDLDFYQSVEKTGGLVPPPPPAEVVIKPTAVPTPAAVAAATPSPARPAAPVPPPAAAPVAGPSAPAAMASGTYTVQVASFKDEKQAQDLVRRLAQAGHPAYLKATEVSGVGNRYRVRVGPYYDKTLAQLAASRIRLQERLAAYVTQME
ncbi:MAG: SPOR domain-containing protein [Deltaproteobacteria bacterium]|nr:SPOR domain-containing protein [Deltaproteobacteria bacterium]